jgi:beta-lactamase superfamily II metal-dependent hydrolase
MPPRRALQVYRVNVGQGDAGIVTLAQKDPPALLFSALVDAGYYHSSESNSLGKNLHRKLNFCLPSRALDMVLLSHLDSDHYKGLLALLDRQAFCSRLESMIAGRLAAF